MTPVAAAEGWLVSFWDSIPFVPGKKADFYLCNNLNYNISNTSCAKFPHTLAGSWEIISLHMRFLHHLEYQIFRSGSHQADEVYVILVDLTCSLQVKPDVMADDAWHGHTPILSDWVPPARSCKRYTLIDGNFP